MQSSKILLTGLLCTLFFTTQAQTKQASSLHGIVRTEGGQPVPGASVQVGNSKQLVITDPQGRYTFENLPPGNYEIILHALGYREEKKKVTLKAGAAETLRFTLKESIQEMDEVSVIGRTENQEVNRQAFNVTSVDAKSLHNSTLDLSHALDRVSGVRVRESGGVGSNFTFSLNGFTGNRVKFFIDGIPMDNFGSSFQINNIPINLADRVEVYKGVVPIWLGSDALGGAVNIVTGNKYRNYIDVSYSYGSFNTHRSGVNAAITSQSGLTFQLNAFQNYSDNDYWVQTEASNIETGEYFPTARIKRFHDQYHNETAIAKVGFVDKPFADKLLLGITLGQNYKEIQTGARMVSVFGAWHRRGNIVMPTLNYAKSDLFIKGLDATLNANYNLGEETNIDTTNARYDWFGDAKRFTGPGGESNYGLYTYKNHNGIATATLNYRISPSQVLTLNNVYNTFDRKGRDKFDPDNISDRMPRQTNKNIVGLGYKYDWNDRLSATAFLKYLHQHAKSGTLYSVDGAYGEEYYREVSTNTDKMGYGAAFSYFIHARLQLKASYEKSNRLPENDELFGDVENLEGNNNLKPESSDNVNLGVAYNFSMQEKHHFSVSANAIYRYAIDYIYWTLNNNQSKYIPSNLEGVSNIGGDAEIRYSFKNLFTAGTNFTYQNVRNEQKYEPNYTGVSPVYHDRLYNLPFMFGNADASFFFHHLGGKGNTLSLGYNLLYVHAFYLYWPSRGNREGKYDVPKQIAHDANVVYTLADGRYNVALECKNITDALLYDNYSMQKPSRGYYLKLRYFINK